MYILKNEPSGYVAGQTILECRVNNEWYATFNAKRVVF